MLFDNAIDGGQTQAGAFADFLGGEKRLEHVAQRVGIHAAAGVGHGQTDKIARPRLRVQHRGNRFEMTAGQWSRPGARRRAWRRGR